MSEIINEFKLNDPASEINCAVSISISFGSWATLIVKSETLSHIKFERKTFTVGVKSKQDIDKTFVSVEEDPSSDVIVDVKVNAPLSGLWKTLLKFAVDEFPLVVEFPSAGDVAVTLIPDRVFSISKVPRVIPETLSIAEIKAWDEESIFATTKSVLKEFEPAVIAAVPITSPTFIEDIVNCPPSELNKALEISASPESWETLTVKSERLSHKRFDRETLTVGEKSKQDK